MITSVQGPTPRRTNPFTKLAGNCKKLATIAKTGLKALKSPGKTVCAATTLASGAERVFNGNLVTGGAQLIAGTYLLSEVLCGPESRPFTELMEDASAGTEAVQQLQVESAKKIQTAKKNLDSIAKQYHNIDAKIAEIRAIKADNNEELDRLKEVAIQKYSAIQVKLAEAAQTLQFAKADSEEVALHITTATEHLHNINTLINSNWNQPTSEETLRDILNSTNEAFEATNESLAINGSLTENILYAQSLILEANSENDEAATIRDQIITIGKDAQTEEILEGMQGELNAMGFHLLQARADINDLEQINGIEQQMAEDIHDNLEDAQGAFSDWGTKSICVGFVATAVGTVVAGPVKGALIGPAAGKAFHERNKISKAANGILGKGTEEIREPDVQTDNVEFTFNAKSSGWAGWWKGRPSKTVGQLEIKFKDETLDTFSIDLNKNRPLSIKNMLKLNTNLTNRLSDELKAIEEMEIDEEDKTFERMKLGSEMKKILRNLQTMEISRGDRGVKHGVVAENSPYFALLQGKLDSLSMGIPVDVTSFKKEQTRLERFTSFFKR